MKNHNWFWDGMSDEKVYEYIHTMLQEYDPDYRRQHEVYLQALDEMRTAGGAANGLDQAYRKAIVSDALFAFNKGLEANLFHFHNPFVSCFIQADFPDLYQEHVMLCMPKRRAAERLYSAIERRDFSEGATWVDTIKEYLAGLETSVPKLMHYLGYLMGNVWFEATVPGYQEDQIATICYSKQISDFFD